MKVGNAVKVSTSRPHIEQYNGLIGQITNIVNDDVIYVCIGRYTRCFYIEELEVIASPVEEGGAA